MFCFVVIISMGDLKKYLFKFTEISGKILCVDRVIIFTIGRKVSSPRMTQRSQRAPSYCCWHICKAKHVLPAMSVCLQNTGMFYMYIWKILNRWYRRSLSYTVGKYIPSYVRLETVMNRAHVIALSFSDHLYND